MGAIGFAHGVQGGMTMRDPKTGNVPNESKLQRALMPNSRMFLLFLIVFAVLTFFFSDRL